MKRNDAPKSKDHFRQRIVGDPFFLGHTLRLFADERGFGDKELAEFLGCGPERLPRLMACRSPNSAAPHFASDVEKIATYAGCIEVRLLLALREVSVLGALRVLQVTTEDAAAHPSLLAARQHRNTSRVKPDSGDDNERPRGT